MKQWLNTSIHIAGIANVMDAVYSVNFFLLLTLHKVHCQCVKPELGQKLWVLSNCNVIFVVLIVQVDLKAILQNFVDVSNFPGISILYIYFVSYLKLAPVTLLAYLLVVHRP